MARISGGKISACLRRAAAAGNTTARGRAYEDLIAYVFQTLPGVTVRARNAHNAAGSEEIDVAFWNERRNRGLPFLPEILLVEVKFWSRPVGSHEVSWFARKLRNRGLSHGVLFAANGITGNAEDARGAHRVLSDALGEGVRVLVITHEQVAALRDTSELIELLKCRLCELVVYGTAV